MNFILMSYGYPPAIIKADANNRAAYYETLEIASTQQDPVPFIRLIVPAVEESLQRYLQAVE